MKKTFWIALALAVSCFIAFYAYSAFNVESKLQGWAIGFVCLAPMLCAHGACVLNGTTHRAEFVCLFQFVAYYAAFPVRMTEILLFLEGSAMTLARSL